MKKDTHDMFLYQPFRTHGNFQQIASVISLLAFVLTTVTILGSDDPVIAVWVAYIA
jgi:hypothetical protein